MNPIDRKIEEIWEKVNEKSPQLIIDWIQCFSESYHKGKEKSKEEVKMTLALKEYQTDPKKNFLWRLMSSKPCEYGYVDTEGDRKDRSGLAMRFIQVLIEDSYWKDFIATTMSLGNSNVNLASSVSALQDTLTKGTAEITTSLHTAARFENVDKVRELIKQGERMQINKHGYTPLHFAAMAIHPQPEIARRLIDSVNGKMFINERTTDGFGGNTALHIAAANVQVTGEFIQQFKDANPLLRDWKNDTPFHVAAKSKNWQAIIYMLNTFSPTNNNWDVDAVDEFRGKNRNRDRNTPIKICARKGNAAAVALLIKHGADISEGVLHEIVIESVKNPKKIENLLRVYHAVVDNVVTWRNLEEKDTVEEPGFLQVKGSVAYEERFRKTLIWLLTNRSVDHGNQNVFECALSHGASVMVWEIIRTKSVFRIHGEKALPYVEGKWKAEKKVEKNHEEEVEDENSSDAENSRTNWTVFDITNFTEETSLKSDLSQNDYSRPQHKNGDHMREKSVYPSDAEGDKDNILEETALYSSNLMENEESQTKQETHSDSSNARNRNFDEKRVPHKPYFTCLLSAYDQWKDSNILSTQPFSELMKPYITTVQRFNFILGLLQLIFMLSFTNYWMPTTCSLALMFNVSATGCSNSIRNDGDDATPSSLSQQRSWMAILWLIWPLILFSENVFMTYHKHRQLRAAHADISRKMALSTKELKSRVFSKIKHATLLLLQNPALRVFCFMMFIWLYIYYWSESHESYIQVTSMVFLFGWITNLSFFGSVTKNVSISKLVLEEVILKDISSFMLFFIFCVIGFSFAIYTIIIPICLPTQIINLHNTFSVVLSSSFGLGDFFEETVADPMCLGATGSTHILLEFVYFAHVCATVIILLNILIAMLNSRYETAQEKAENEWRFEILFTMTALKSTKCFRCCSELLTPRSYHYNKDLKRHLVQLLVPVDEQLKKLK